LKIKQKGASARINSSSTTGGASTLTEDPHSDVTAQDTQKEELKLRGVVGTDNKKLSTSDILNAVPYYKVFANVRMLGCQHASEQFFYINRITFFIVFHYFVLC
jgi:hypothetical protein